MPIDNNGVKVFRIIITGLVHFSATLGLITGLVLILTVNQHLGAAWTGSLSGIFGAGLAGVLGVNLYQLKNITNSIKTKKEGK